MKDGNANSLQVSAACPQGHARCNFLLFFLFENNFIEKKLKLATRPLEGNQGQCCDRCTSESFFKKIRIKSAKIYFGIELNE